MMGSPDSARVRAVRYLGNRRTDTTNSTTPAITTPAITTTITTTLYAYM